MQTKMILMKLTFILAAVSVTASTCTGDEPDETDAGLTEFEKLYADGCGPCGTVATGDGTISGDGAMDGYFKAVGSLSMAYARINSDFEANARQLALAFDVKGVAAMDIGTLADAAVTKIRAELNNGIKGGMQKGLKVSYTEPRCLVSPRAALEAQAQCEIKAGCTANKDCPENQLSFECRGACEGACTGHCDLQMCNVGLDEDDLLCTGECSGLCVQTNFEGLCEGICRGKCDGECSAWAENASEDDITDDFVCNGSCDNTCYGLCKLPTQGQMCNGRCEGECKVQVKTGVTCTGDMACRGLCDTRCVGLCKGEVRMPKCEGTPLCDASVRCEGQALANAGVNAVCSQPVLKLDYALKSELLDNANKDEKAKFLGKMQALEKYLVNILRGMKNLRVLSESGASAEMGIDPPVTTIRNAVIDLQNINLDPKDTNVEPEYDVVLPLVPCTTTALTESIGVLDALAAKMRVTISVQRKFHDLLLI